MFTDLKETALGRVLSTLPRWRYFSAVPNVPKNYPSPIVYGPDFPQFKMLMRHGKQVFESRTNQNLFLEDGSSFLCDFDEGGTFTMARFLRKLSTWQDCAPLLFDVIAMTGDTFDWMEVYEEPRWEACPACADLLGYCDSEAQRKFLRWWWSSQYVAALGSALERWLAWLQNVGSSRGASVIDVVQARGAGVFVFTLLDLVLDFPALVPEVWLNYVGWERTAADEKHLAENPQRVDFVLFGAGKKAVIEIDGPSHYADYDPDTRTYTISETRYAKNLKIERSLRRWGWEIYRFANLEMNGVDNDTFVGLIQDIPGVDDALWLGRSIVNAEKLREGMGDAERFLVTPS